MKIPFVKLPSLKTFHFGKEASLEKAYEALNLGKIDFSLGRSEILRSIFSALDHDDKIAQVGLFNDSINSDHIFNTSFGVDTSDMRDDELVDVMLAITNCHVDTFWNGFSMKDHKAMTDVFKEAIDLKESIISNSNSFEKLFENVIVSTGSMHLRNSEKMLLKLMKKNMFQFFSPFHLEALESACDEIIENENSLADHYSELKKLFSLLKSAFQSVFSNDHVFWLLKDDATSEEKKRSANVVTPQIEMFKKRAKIIGNQKFSKNYAKNGKIEENVRFARKLSIEEMDEIDGKITFERIVISVWFAPKKIKKPLRFMKVN